MAAGKTQQRFKQYEHRSVNAKEVELLLVFSVSDVWDTDITVNDKLAHDSANRVLAQHASGTLPESAPRSPKAVGNKAQSINFKTSALQRLAMQKGGSKEARCS